MTSFSDQVFSLAGQVVVFMAAPAALVIGLSMALGIVSFLVAQMRNGRG